LKKDSQMLHELDEENFKNAKQESPEMTLQINESKIETEIESHLF
jgi:hypothetical protein